MPGRNYRLKSASADRELGRGTFEDRQNRDACYRIRRFALLSNWTTGTVTVEIFAGPARIRVKMFVQWYDTSLKFADSVRA